MKKNRILFLSAVTVIFCAALSLFIPYIKVLSISNRLDPEKMYCVKASSLKGYEISYTHSVNKGRVHDCYQILDDDTLLLDTTIFVSYGAGIPEPEETPGAVFTVTERGYEISNLQRRLKKYLMAVGIIANHGLTLQYADRDEQYFTMTDLFAPQTSLVFEVVRVSLFTYMKNKL